MSRTPNHFRDAAHLAYQCGVVLGDAGSLDMEVAFVQRNCEEAGTSPTTEEHNGRS